MKICLLVFVCTAYFTTVSHGQTFDSSDPADFTWETFKTTFGKSYESTTLEQARQRVWQQNMALIEAHNAEADQGIHSYRAGVNALADLTPSEISQRFGARVPRRVLQNSLKLSKFASVTATVTATPTSYDLRGSQCIPAIKDQGNCGSCWAFAATTPLEYKTCIATGIRTSLSESQLTNCSSAYGNSGCNGGFYTNAWNYIRAAPGIAKSSVLPYFPTQGACRYNSFTMGSATLSSFTTLAAKNPALMMQTLVNQGPLATAMWVDSRTFSYYSSGVYSFSRCPNTCSSSGINHAVVIVGYNIADSANRYWIIRNSWGTSWGLAGYFLIRLGVNMCNCECMPSDVTL